MAKSLALSCKCGAVKGELKYSPGDHGHLACYCTDCQGWKTWLGADPGTMDELGCSHYVQCSLTALTLTCGRDKLKAIKLTPKTVTIRWHTDCCKTPVGAAASFLSLVDLAEDFISDTVTREQRDDAFGPISIRFFALSSARGDASALTNPRPYKSHLLMMLSYMVSAVGLIRRLWWAGRPLNVPSPLTDTMGKWWPLAEIKKKDD